LCAHRADRRCRDSRDDEDGVLTTRHIVLSVIVQSLCKSRIVAAPANFSMIDGHFDRADKMSGFWGKADIVSPAIQPFNQEP
jgi:hypothetical protein